MALIEKPEVDKSATHVRVQKNGTECWLNKTTWETIGGDSNKDGWTRVNTMPIEVIELKAKKKPEVNQDTAETEEVEAPLIDNVPGEIVEVKRRGRKAK